MGRFCSRLQIFFENAGLEASRGRERDFDGSIYRRFVC